MLSPDIAYQIAKQDHQARIAAAARRRGAREARAAQTRPDGHWITSLPRRLRPVPAPILVNVEGGDQLSGAGQVA
ncbi:MAG TPA: hypothetical protein VEK76_01985 [Candidatus Binatia bacterium]|nr:hypothetical protein [Candidatus Binatia bacterium]